MFNQPKNKLKNMNKKEKKNASLRVNNRSGLQTKV